MSIQEEADKYIDFMSVTYLGKKCHGSEGSKWAKRAKLLDKAYRYLKADQRLEYISGQFKVYGNMEIVVKAEMRRGVCRMKAAELYRQAEEV